MATRFQSGTGIKRVRGLGSAKSGVHHWWMQRVTAISNLMLFVWFFASLLLLPSLSYSSVTAWIAQPVVAVPMLLLIASIVWHARLGMQVMIEDYLHAEGTKMLALLALNFYAIAAAATAAFAVLSIAVGGK
jgi:succinate dehydrogenase / fumarate reductase membrane anchor subunit